MTRFCIDPVERCIQSIEADPATPGGLVRQVRRQRRAIFEVGKVVDADQHGNRLAVLADGDGTVALPGLSDELTQVRLGRSQRIRHVLAVTPCTDHRGQQRSQRACGHGRANCVFLIPQTRNAI
jgi:hypothetical protein